MNLLMTVKDNEGDANLEVDDGINFVGTETF